MHTSLRELQMKMQLDIVTKNNVGLNYIADQPPISREKRLSVYSYAYSSRLIESLEGDYEELSRVLGHDLFVKLIEEYLIEYPSCFYTIADVGKHLPDFLRYYDLSSELPYLPDLAQLEWNYLSALFAEDAEEFDGAKLSAFNESQWSELRFKFNPSVSLLYSDWSIDKIWGDHEPAKINPTYLLMYRDSFDVEVMNIEATQFQVLQKLMRGETLGQVCEWLEHANLSSLENSAEEDFRAETQLMGWFKWWMECKILSDVSLS